MPSFGYFFTGLTNQSLPESAFDMLVYQVIGPDTNGLYHLAYPTPGALNSITLAGNSRSKIIADEECERLNELQIIDRRAVIRDRADRLVGDLVRDDEGDS